MLLGLVAEDQGRGGFMGSGLTVDKARGVVEGRAGAGGDAARRQRPPKELPFSRQAKKLFEAALLVSLRACGRAPLLAKGRAWWLWAASPLPPPPAIPAAASRPHAHPSKPHSYERTLGPHSSAPLQESRRMGMSFIAPEHLLLALLSVGDAGSRRLLAGLALDGDALRAEALRRLKGEAEGEGARQRVSLVSRGGGRGAAQARRLVRRAAPRRAAPCALPAASLPPPPLPFSSQAAAGAGRARGVGGGTPTLDEFCRDLCAEVLVGVEGGAAGWLAQRWPAARASVAFSVWS